MAEGDSNVRSLTHWILKLPRNRPEGDSPQYLNH